MRINGIGTGVQNQTKLPIPASEKAQQSAGDPSQVSKLTAEIKQAEAEMKEIMKEVQKAAAESVGGGSEKAQMLQSKILMQQQEIMAKQMQIKEIQSPKEATSKQAASATSAQPRFDRYESEQAGATAPDNVYRLDEKDGARQIVFNRALPHE